MHFYIWFLPISECREFDSLDPSDTCGNCKIVSFVFFSVFILLRNINVTINVTINNINKKDRDISENRDEVMDFLKL